MVATTAGVHVQAKPLTPGSENKRVKLTEDEHGPRIDQSEDKTPVDHQSSSTSKHDHRLYKVRPAVDICPEITLMIFEQLALDDPITRTSVGWARISHVCRRWRELALARMPREWARVVVSLGRDLVDTLVERAASFPLSITIPHPPTTSDDEEEETYDLPDESHEYALSAAMRYIARLQYLEDETFSSDIMASFLAGRTCAELHELKLGRTEMSTLNISSLMPLDAPILRRLTYDSIFLPVQAPRLACLSITGSLPRTLDLSSLFKLMSESSQLEEIKLTISMDGEPAGHSDLKVQLPSLRRLRLRGDTAALAIVYSRVDIPRDAKVEVIVIDGEPTARFVKGLLGFDSDDALGITTSVLERDHKELYSLSFSAYPSTSNFDVSDRRVSLIFRDLSRNEVGTVVRSVVEATSCQEVDISSLSYRACDTMGLDEHLFIPHVYSLVVNLMQTRILQRLQCARPVQLFPEVRRLGMRLMDTSTSHFHMFRRESAWDTLIQLLGHLSRADEKCSIERLRVFDDPRRVESSRLLVHDGDDQTGLCKASRYTPILDHRPLCVRDNYLSSTIKAMCTVGTRQFQEFQGWESPCTPDGTTEYHACEGDDSDDGESSGAESRRLVDLVEERMQTAFPASVEWGEASDEALGGACEPTDEEFFGTSEDSSGDEDECRALEEEDLGGFSDDEDDGSTEEEEVVVEDDTT